MLICLNKPLHNKTKENISKGCFYCGFAFKLSYWWLGKGGFYTNLYSLGLKSGDISRIYHCEVHSNIFFLKEIECKLKKEQRTE